VSDTDYTPHLAASGQMILGELLDRLDADVSERDAAAMSAAVTKASLRGFDLGQASVCEQLPASVSIIGGRGRDETEVDLWAERYEDQS